MNDALITQTNENGAAIQDFQTIFHFQRTFELNSVRIDLIAANDIRQKVKFYYIQTNSFEMSARLYNSLCSFWIFNYTVDKPIQ